MRPAAVGGWVAARLQARADRAGRLVAGQQALAGGNHGRGGGAELLGVLAIIDRRSVGRSHGEGGTAADDGGRRAEVEGERGADEGEHCIEGWCDEQGSGIGETRSRSQGVPLGARTRELDIQLASEYDTMLGWIREEKYRWGGVSVSVDALQRLPPTSLRRGFGCLLVRRPTTPQHSLRGSGV